MTTQPTEAEIKMLKALKDIQKITQDIKEIRLMLNGSVKGDSQAKEFQDSNDKEYSWTSSPFEVKQ